MKLTYRVIMYPVWIIGFIVLMIGYGICKLVFTVLIDIPFLGKINKKKNK